MPNKIWRFLILLLLTGPSVVQAQDEVNVLATELAEKHTRLKISARITYAHGLIHPLYERCRSNRGECSLISDGIRISLLLGDITKERRIDLLFESQTNGRVLSGGYLTEAKELAAGTKDIALIVEPLVRAKHAIVKISRTLTDIGKQNAASYHERILGPDDIQTISMAVRSIDEALELAAPPK
ncbi:MAG: hypothetical protein Q7T82_20185 [Armatimonadota bacterium]|nr:hypothetical protein [Armatimonadota bacterium]